MASSVKKISGYYFITDSALSRAGNISDVKNAVSAGAGVVQYRNKAGSTLEMYREALILRKACRNTVFLVNDRLDIALSVNADGVHIGQDDLPFQKAREMLGKSRIIGVTAHNLKEALKAQRLGADYIGFSPVFSTTTKKDAGKPAGTKLLAEIKSIVSIPVVAIGGITLSNAPDVIVAGADSLCAISAVICSRDVRAQIKKFQALFEL